MRTALVLVQSVTFLPLGVLMCVAGDWRLGIAQFLLAGVTAAVYL